MTLPTSLKSMEYSGNNLVTHHAEFMTYYIQNSTLRFLLVSMGSFFKLTNIFCTNIELSMLINMISMFYHNRKIFSANLLRIFQFGTVKITASAFASVIFSHHFITWQGLLLSLGLGWVWLWTFYHITYAHNGPFDERINVGIPALNYFRWSHIRSKCRTRHVTQQTSIAAK